MRLSESTIVQRPSTSDKVGWTGPTDDVATYGFWIEPRGRL